MFQGNWKCSVCGGAITELPFEPRSENGLTCRDCFLLARGLTASNAQAGAQTSQKQRGGGSRQSAPQESRKMFFGDWKCSGCGAAVTELPFQPRDTGNPKCLECFKKSRT